MEDLNINEKEAFYYLLEIPKLITSPLKENIEGINFYFYLYFRFSKETVTQIFKDFPYLFCLDPEKVDAHCQMFVKHEFSNEEILHLLKHAGGVIASSRGTIEGIFIELMNVHKLTNQEVREILWHYPEFIFQKKEDLLPKKVELIKQYSKKDDSYITNLIKRHPAIFLKSLASYEAKINYYARTLNKPLRNEDLFPMFLHFNYNGVIRPRIECLRSQGIKEYDLSRILPCSDEEFCLRFDVPGATLDDKKNERTIREEKDVLWSYAAGA